MNLNPTIAQALTPWTPPTTVVINHRWLAMSEAELRNARRRYESKPDWNPDKQLWASAITKIERDIEELKAGVQPEDLTSVKNWKMPEWGTYGT